MAGIEQVGTQGTDTCSGIRDRKAVKLVDLFVVGEGVVCVMSGIIVVVVRIWFLTQ